MTDLLPFLAAFALTLALTPLVRQFALRYNIVDQPGERRVNKTPIPRMGGLAVVASFILVVLAFAVLKPESLHFTGSQIAGIDKNLVGVLVGALILVTGGIIDDIRGLSPLLKLGFQLAAAAMIPAFGIHIQWLANPLGGSDLQLPLFIDNILIVLWIVAVINVVNWLDGLDGLATGVGTIAALILFQLSATAAVHQPATALLAIIIAGSSLGFLPYNFNPARIFLGDSGSMVIGFLLAILAVISGGKVATAGLVLGIPILDAAWVILRRIVNRQSPWIADRRHLHHRLLDAGLSQRVTVMFYWLLAGLFGSLALLSRTEGKTVLVFGVFGLMFVVGISLVVADRIKGRKLQQ